MSRTESLAMWARIARGDLEDPEENNEDLFKWIKATAAAVIEADGEPVAGKRPGEIVCAVGLTGKEDPYARLRELIDLWQVLKAIDTGNVVIQPADRETRETEDVAGVYALAMERGVLWGEYLTDPKKAKDLIRDLWPTRPK